MGEQWGGEDECSDEWSDECDDCRECSGSTWTSVGDDDGASGRIGKHHECVDIIDECELQDEHPCREAAGGYCEWSTMGADDDDEPGCEWRCWSWEQYCADECGGDRECECDDCWAGRAGSGGIVHGEDADRREWMYGDAMDVGHSCWDQRWEWSAQSAAERRCECGLADWNNDSFELSGCACCEWDCEDKHRHHWERECDGGGECEWSDSRLFWEIAGGRHRGKWTSVDLGLGLVDQAELWWRVWTGEDCGDLVCADEQCDERLEHGRGGGEQCGSEQCGSDRGDVCDCCGKRMGSKLCEWRRME
jgi:hypothetical protein